MPKRHKVSDFGVPGHIGSTSESLMQFFDCISVIAIMVLWQSGIMRSQQARCGGWRISRGIAVYSLMLLLATKPYLTLFRSLVITEPRHFQLLSTLHNQVSCRNVADDILWHGWDSPLVVCSFPTILLPQKTNARGYPYDGKFEARSSCARNGEWNQLASVSGSSHPPHCPCIGRQSLSLAKNSCASLTPSSQSTQTASERDLRKQVWWSLRWAKHFT